MKEHLAKRAYWRSLEQLAGSASLAESAKHEFAAYDPEEMLSMPELTRRRFMQLMGASMALAGLTLNGCRRWPEEKLAPYTSNPTNRIPGKPEQYATVMELDGVAVPLLVSSYDGRPIKIEGNPSHPYSATVPGKIGSADAIAQASVLEVYDPDRSRSVMEGHAEKRSESDWSAFVKQLQGWMAEHEAKQGEGLAILSEPSSSPTTRRLKAAVLARLPKAQWIEYCPLSRDNEAAGIKMAVGRSARLLLDLSKAKVIVSFDADLLGTHPAHIRYAGDWALGRTSDSRSMSRLYIAESRFSTTGSVADHRLPIRPSRVGAVMAAVAGLSGAAAALEPGEKPFVERVTKDLSSAGGKAVIAVGSHLAPELHALGLALNAQYGQAGNTFLLLDDGEDQRPSHFEGIAQLTSAIKSAAVTTLVILGGNPVYDAPADIDFPAALAQLNRSAHLSLFDNETSKLCLWHIPRAHYLEAWTDARAWNGSVSVCQPLIEPFFDGKTPGQLLALMAGQSEIQSDELVRTTLSGIAGSDDFDLKFKHILREGLMVGSGFATLSASISAPPGLPSQAQASGFELRFLQDSRVYDGRFAGNGWLQEMPDPLTKVVWDNTALISKKDADQLNVETGSMLKITVGQHSLQIAAYVLPGQPVGVIGLPLGYGRGSAGHIGTDVGFNTYQLRTSEAPWSVGGAQVVATGQSYQITTTQNQHMIDAIGAQGRDERVGKDRYENSDIIREATVEEFEKTPEMFKKAADKTVPLQLFDPPPDPAPPHSWGMAIDMSVCIGCQACVIACQAENNIPIVGKDQVERNRQMHWIRIDRYFKGDVAEPEVSFQPVTCQQCENAPCEQVCPVGATMHDTEGINVMVYNRCVGTRYCSNNCPYKVRRFNYLDFHSQDPRNDKFPKPYLNIPDQQQLEQVDKMHAMVFNPEVTVRMRGVMEKCNYCLQRIHNTQIAKRAAGEDLADGDVITACQQACPTRAIAFGDLLDPASQVSGLHRNMRAYNLLGDLNTRPRNRYLAKISNPGETAQTPAAKGEA